MSQRLLIGVFCNNSLLGIQLSLLMIDVDDFKSVNDRKAKI